MTKKIAWIHIGLPKTGTSTVQRLMRENAPEVEKRGLSLMQATLPNTGSLERYAADDQHIRRARRRRGETDSASIRAHRKFVETEFQRVLQGSLKDKWFFSDENLTFLTSESEFQRLKDLMYSNFAEVKIIVYLRAQHEHAISAFSQRLRLGGTSTSILKSPTKESDGVNLYAYDELLTRWATAFGDVNTVVRIFDRSELLDGDIVSDIFAILGVAREGLTASKDQNLALSTDQQALLLHVNRYLPPVVDGKINMARDDLLRAMHELPRTDKGILPSRNEVRNFISLFSESNERVRKAWFPDRDALFNIDFSIFPETSGSLKITKDALSSVFAEVLSAYWLFLQNKNEVMQKRKSDRVKLKRQSSQSHH